MSDVPEGPAVDERGRPVERLDQVRLDRVLHEDRHGARGPQLARGDGRARNALADDHPLDPRLEVLEVFGQTQDRHDLRGHGDVEPGLARHAVGRPAEAGDDVAQGAVVHVHDALPRDAPDVEPERVALGQVVVEHRG